MTNTEDLRIGVIGAGGRGSIARHAHRPGAGSKIVACCDLDPRVLSSSRTDFGEDVFVTSDYRELLDRPLDAVFVTTPDWLHEEHALAALERGLAVYLEKPMCIDIPSCDRLLRAARDKSARLFVGHNMRYMTIFRKMKQLIDDGAIGNVKAIWCRHFIGYGGDAYFRDWHADRSRSTGLLLQKGAHDIDVIHWLAGAYTRRVSAFGNLAVYGDLPRRTDPYIDKTDFSSWWNDGHWPPNAQSGFNPVIDIEDQSVVNMQLEHGILASYLQCHFTPDSCRNYTVIGDAGRMENMGDGPRDPIFVWNKRGDYRFIGDEVHRGESADAGGHGGSDELIVREFLDFVCTGASTTATPEAARMSVATGCQATESLRSGGSALDVPPIDWVGSPASAT